MKWRASRLVTCRNMTLTSMLTTCLASKLFNVATVARCQVMKGKLCYRTLRAKSAHMFQSPVPTVPLMFSNTTFESRCLETMFSGAGDTLAHVVSLSSLADRSVWRSAPNFSPVSKSRNFTPSGYEPIYWNLVLRTWCFHRSK